MIKILRQTQGKLMLEIVVGFCFFFVMKNFYFKINTEDKKGKIKESKKSERRKKCLLVVSQDSTNEIKVSSCELMLFLYFCFKITVVVQMNSVSSPAEYL